MLELARRAGISVPENKLVDIASIKGLPEQAHTVESKALAVKRFDSLPDGKPVHMEDFAQLFGQFPNDKYKHRSYAILRPFSGRKAAKKPPGSLSAVSFSPC